MFGFFTRISDPFLQGQIDLTFFPWSIISTCGVEKNIVSGTVLKEEKNIQLNKWIGERKKGHSY